MELTERERAVVERQERLDDAYSSLTGMRLASAPGPAPSKKRCQMCNATGRVRILEKRRLHGRQTPSKRWRDRICPGCKGERFLAATRAEIAAGEAVDPYTEKYDSAPARIRAFGEHKPRTMTRETMDATLARLRADEYERQGVIDGRPPESGGGYAWERQVARLRQNDGIREYLRAEGVLRRKYPDVHPRSLVGVRFIAMEMRGPVRVPDASREEVHESRREAVLRLAGQGESLTKIAQLVGIRRGKVKHILRLAA